MFEETVVRSSTLGDRLVDRQRGLWICPRSARRRPHLFASIRGGRRAGSSWACCMSWAWPQ